MKLLYLLLFILIVSELDAQDVHLSQFYTNHQNINPALTGAFDAEYKITANYRNQWRQIAIPMTTAMASFERSFSIKDQKISAGVIIMNDQFSGFNLTTNKIFLSGAYEYPIASNKLRFGISTGIVLKSTDFSTQTFPVQWNYDLGDFDTNLGNNEPILDESLNYLDLNAGLAWLRNFTNRIKVKAGYAIFHVHKPKESYLGNREKLKWRHVGHASAGIGITKFFSLEPEILFMTTTRTTDFVVGSKLRYELTKLQGQPAVFAGALYRTSFNNPDAIIPLIGMAYRDFELGFSYDFNISSLSDNYNKTTYEISLIYLARRSEAAQISIPCERY